MGQIHSGPRGRGRSAMMIHEITEQAGKYKARKRIGRGPGSGRGKTSTRGHKGAGSRAGHSTRYQFEGGQMPFFRRLPRWGFTNAEFKTHYWIVNLRDIAAHPDFAKGGDVNPHNSPHLLWWGLHGLIEAIRVTSCTGVTSQLLGLSDAVGVCYPNA